MSGEHEKIIIQQFGLEQVTVLKNYGTMAGTIANNEINGQVPNVSNLLYRGSVKLLEAQNKVTPNSDQYKGLTPSKNIADDPDGKSILGTPVWGRLVFNTDTYTDTTFGKISYPTQTFDTVIITITQSHNVVLTPIQGRDYEVIEYIGKASWRINVKGGIFGTGNKRPVAEIGDLKRMLNSNQPLFVGQNSFLNEWDISEIVILNKNIPQMEGGYNYQLFEFDAIQNTTVRLAQQQNVS